MLFNIFATIKHDFISISFVSCLGIYVLYLLITQLLLLNYRSRHSKKPQHYRMFRLYNKNLISNAPSKKEKKFYQLANKVTIAFNSMLLAMVLMFVIACFI